MSRPKPVVLAIIDGWGIAPASDGNAIERAETPHMDQFIREYPALTLYASGNEVGLSYGEMGNSEVGHLNIGAGRCEPFNHHAAQHAVCPNDQPGFRLRGVRHTAARSISNSRR